MLALTKTTCKTRDSATEQPYAAGQAHDKGHTLSSATSRRTLESLRSQRWLAPDDMRSFAHRQRLQQMGLRREEFLDRPVIAIINTWSDLSPCHSHLRERAEAVKRGILLAGGFPVELPALSLGEVMVKPTDRKSVV